MSKAEQKLIRRDLKNEHLKLVGNDLDLASCEKKNGWEISPYEERKKKIRFDPAWVAH